MIAIIDYQAGNQTSVRRALEHLGLESEITADPERLRQATGLIFPGVGAAGQAMGLLTETGLDSTIRELVTAGRPFLGVCLGCQIMLESSEENDTKTLGIISGRNVRFDPAGRDEAGHPIRIPHMGWNNLRPVQETALLSGISEKDQFYFVHSYYPLPAPEYILGVTRYGVEFSSVFGREGLWAVQFHPEKSGPPGLRLLRNFHEYCVRAERGEV
ncbi:imidazole glycerol phosphate synthase subunit HisH [Deltaproteobacteria bacterium Smac51]|nr:imidazole glycerol phosphate synthase subunit HisH [Deltaproteobacteria bacterium Smac51]